MENKRICAFCNLTATYDELPEGSICYLGVMACAACLEKEETKKFREVIENNVKK